MKQPRFTPSKLLPPVGRPAHKQLTPSGRPVGWIEGYAGTPHKQLSGHQLRASLVAVHAPLVLASPLPTIAALAAQSQRSENNYVTAGTVEVSGIKSLTFFIKNIDENERSLLARPFWVIDSERFVDDTEDPYLILSAQSVRIPIVCDAEVVGLEVKNFVTNQPTRYTVGVGVTP